MTNSASFARPTSKHSIPAFLDRHAPLIVVLAAFGAGAAMLLTMALRQTDGQLIYARDDTYIHMAMSRNLAQLGVWGVTRYGFSSSSSSLLWTLILALAYIVTGIHELTPLILNAIAALLTLIAAYRGFRRLNIPDPVIFLSLLLIAFAAPLPALILIGMENTLQVLLATLYLFSLAEIISNREVTPGSRQGKWLLFLTPLVTSIRYEGLFAVAVVFGLLIVQRRWWFAGWVLLLGFTPIVIYGIVSYSQGWLFFPSSVILKARNFNGPIDYLVVLYVRLRDHLFYTPLMAYLIIAALMLLISRNDPDQPFGTSQVMLATFIVTAVLQILLAEIGGFYRYEAYLIVTGLAALTAAIPWRDIAQRYLRWDWRLLPAQAAILGLALFLVAGLTARAVKSFIQTPRAANSTYAQQVQMGHFLHDYYTGEKVAANDIGAINYLADIQNIDLVGLGTREITHLKAHNTYTQFNINAITTSEGVSIALVYDWWFDEQLLSRWVKVGEWTLLDPVAVGGSTVSFYAVDPDETAALAAHLCEFSPQLPDGVTWQVVAGPCQTRTN